MPPRGLTYWERLATILNNETLADRERFFMAMLRPLGIEKGKPFQPDARQKKILAGAALVGEAMAKANSFDKRFEGARYRSDAHWDFVFVPSFSPEQDMELTASSTNALATLTKPYGRLQAWLPRHPAWAKLTSTSTGTKRATRLTAPRPTAQGAEGFRKELDSDRARPVVVPLVPTLRPARAYFDKSWPLPDIEKAK